MNDTAAKRRTRRPMPKRYTEPLAFQITPEMRDQLDDLAEQRNVSLSAAVRELLQVGLDELAKRKAQNP